MLFTLSVVQCTDTCALSVCVHGVYHNSLCRHEEMMVATCGSVRLLSVFHSNADEGRIFQTQKSHI